MDLYPVLMDFWHASIAANQQQSHIRFDEEIRPGLYVLYDASFDRIPTYGIDIELHRPGQATFRFAISGRFDTLCPDKIRSIVSSCSHVMAVSHRDATPEHGGCERTEAE